ncbi:alpha/beta fold hydrolase [Nocardiopsis trehalosi]|jgi:pimeloyl-ACP methyl ester carboxylesterase|uniref:alpha/beta fold hydrolase n=1 Tax=Nocardiopsis trehalosi TaxID=109329 RepID=UPI00082D563B|nr:alpha/beta hydrolase [Nocardiopsis trehalosi]
MPDPIAPWPGGLRRLGGRTVHVRTDAAPGGCGADRPRTVYVHGLAGSSTNWTDLMGELCPEFAGEAVDLPGFGLSPPPADGDYSIDAHAAAVTGLLAAGDHPAHLVGNSMGGAVAVRVAAEAPDLVRSLTLISPALPDLWPRRVPYQMAGALVPVLGPAVYTRLQSRPAEARVRATFGATFHDPDAAPAQRVREALEAERAREEQGHAQEAVLGSLRSLVTEYVRRGPRSLWRQAAGVRCPTLLVYAFEDRFVNPRVARRAARTFPDRRIVLMPRTGHLPMMEHPRRTARLLRPFLREASAPAGPADRVTGIADHGLPGVGMPNPTP